MFPSTFQISNKKKKVTVRHTGLRGVSKGFSIEQQHQKVNILSLYLICGDISQSVLQKKRKKVENVRFGGSEPL